MTDLALAPARSPLADEILVRLDTVLPVADGPYALHEPKIGGNAWEYVRDCLDTGWVSSAGAWVERFETMLASFTGCRHAIATVNGTAALHTCLLLAGVQAGDEVLVPSLKFVATANAVRYCGAEPHFVDCEAASLGVDPLALDVHLANVAEMRGGRCFNRRTGRFSRVAAVSFNGNKTVTTGGGGAILTDDPILAARARHLTTTARLPATDAVAHDLVAFNYRMPNLNAALGCAQLEQLADLLASKRRLAQKLLAAFDGLDGASIMREPAWGHSNYWLNALILEPAWRDERPYVLHALNDAGYQCRPFWTPMHELPMYAGAPRAPLPVTDRIAACGINLPSSPGLA
jgi:perosamine synthetase